MAGFFQRLADSMVGLAVRPVAPPSRSIFVPDDEPSEPADEESSDEAATWAAWIDYRDVKGVASRRIVTIRSIDGAAGVPESFMAFCNTRKAVRRFRIDRIKEMACVMTGELIDPMENCQLLQRHGALKINDRALTELARIVTFVARCDQEFHQLEEDALEAIFERYARFFEGNDEMVETAVCEAQRLAPSGNDVTKAIRAMASMPHAPELARFAIRACGEVIDADGVIRKEETEWAAAIGDALKVIAAGQRG